MLSRQHQLLTVAVMAALSLSACGKKKDLVSAERPAPQAEQKKDDATLQDRQPGLGGGLEEGTAEMPAPGQKAPNGQNLGGADLPPPPSLPSKHQPAPQESRPAPLPQASQPLPQHERPEARQDERQDEVDNSSELQSNGLHLTGGRGSDGLVYTSAGDDNVHDILRARNQRVDFNSRRLNLAAAGAVISARLDMNSSSSLVNLKVREQGEERTYRLSGAMGGSLKIVRSGTTGRQPVDGTLQCLDADQNLGGLCENVFARLRVGATGSSGIVNVIFRQSSADMHFSLPGQRSGNPDYETLRDFVMSAIHGDVPRDRIAHIRFNTWEVTNGRSGFVTAFKTAGNEEISYAGPLLASTRERSLNVALTRTNELGGRSSYADLLGGAQLVSNNGAGKIVVAMSTRLNRRYDRDTLMVTFKKRVKPVIQLR